MTWCYFFCFVWYDRNYYQRFQVFVNYCTCPVLLCYHSLVIFLVCLCFVFSGGWVLSVFAVFFWLKFALNFDFTVLFFHSLSFLWDRGIVLLFHVLGFASPSFVSLSCSYIVISGMIIDWLGFLVFGTGLDQWRLCGSSVARWDRLFLRSNPCTLNGSKTCSRFSTECFWSCVGWMDSSYGFSSCFCPGPLFH